MSVLRPRNRLVNFRLSEDEFEKLKASCAMSGARSISDFARSSVLERMDQPHPGSAGSGKWMHLDGKVADLERRVGELLNLIEATSNAPVGTVDSVPV